MNMQENNLQQLMIVCQQMAKSGTPPSVGLLRARAPFKVSVTQAIEAIKRFNIFPIGAVVTVTISSYRDYASR